MGEMPQAEIVLYEDVIEDPPETQELIVRGDNPGILMKKATDTHFMDSRRNKSPFGW